MIFSKGYTVYALDAVEGDKLKALKSDKCKTAVVDVTSPESIEKFKKSLGDEPVDLLLNIAGQCFDPIRRIDGRLSSYKASCPSQRTMPVRQ